MTTFCSRKISESHGGETCVTTKRFGKEKTHDQENIKQEHYNAPTKYTILNHVGMQIHQKNECCYFLPMCYNEFVRQRRDENEDIREEKPEPNTLLVNVVVCTRLCTSGCHAMGFASSLDKFH